MLILNYVRNFDFEMYFAKIFHFKFKDQHIFRNTSEIFVKERTHLPSFNNLNFISYLQPNKSESSLSSYRPISLLVTFSKVFERILSRRMSPILAELNIIPEHQFGFRSGHGTVEQCNRITKSNTNAFECKQY